MLSSPTTAAAAKSARGKQLDDALRELLDHVAVELAHEYVRLLEAAAEADSNEDAPDTEEE